MNRIITVNEEHVYIKDNKRISKDELITINNNLLSEGFRFKVRGDFEFDGYYENGFPTEKENLHFFKQLKDAKYFASNQIAPYSQFRPDPEKLVYMETQKERNAREEKEKAEKKERILKKDQAEATKLGLSLEDYRQRKKDLAKARSLVRKAEKNKATAESLEKEASNFAREADRLFKKWK